MERNGKKENMVSVKVKGNGMNDSAVYGWKRLFAER